MEVGFNQEAHDLLGGEEKLQEATEIVGRIMTAAIAEIERVEGKRTGLLRIDMGIPTGEGDIVNLITAIYSSDEPDLIRVTPQQPEASFPVGEDGFSYTPTKH